MNNIKLLDVTLRDGGYKTNFYFALDTIKSVLTKLDRSGVDYIEVGYRNGSFKPIPNIGPSGICNREYLEYCKMWVRSAKLTVIFHPINIKEYDFEEMRDCGVNTLRICFSAQDPNLGFKSIELAKKYGFEFFTNITRISQYSQNQLLKLVDSITQYTPKAIYLADSNGSFTPEKVGDLFSYLHSNTMIPLGFHAHDNLFLAQANAIAAINNGAEYIDASLMGLGKGAGNLRTEGFVSFLCSKGVERFNLCGLLNAAECIKLKVKDDENNLPIKNIIMGVFDLSQDDAISLGAFSDITDYYNRAEQYHRSAKFYGEKYVTC